MPLRASATSDLWWKNAVVYCLDVETFADSDGDGCGDLAGLVERIDHVANLRALVEQGCDRVLAIASVGSLRPELPVGSLLCPDDFIALGIGASVFADARAHSAPGFDPDGEYVRRYLPELESVAGRAVHEPWRLDGKRRRRLDYPQPIVDHDEAAAAFIARRT